MIEESEEGGDESMASEDPSNVPGSLEAPAVLTNHFESRILRKQVVREVSHDNENKKLDIQAELQAAVDRNKVNVVYVL